MHPVEQRHQRIQALTKFTRAVMQKTYQPQHQRDEMIDNYCRQHWALGDTALRDYKKTVLMAIQAEVEISIRKQLDNLKVIPVPLE